MELQRKFARGVNCNMKVVIKGDGRVGKTSLFLRLKGYGFEDNYTPTETLNVTSIDWNYKATDDIVKIDLWEAIDACSRERKSVNFVDLKMENKASEGVESNGGIRIDDQSQSLAPKVILTNTRLSSNTNAIMNSIPESAKQSLAQLSETIDVYKGAHAVLLVMDMTKSWTFRYIQNELPKVPKSLPVLIVANHRDQGHHRTVSREQVQAFLEGSNREPCDGTLMYTEASMKNGFGLKLIEKFFNIPFLKLQEANLLKQLELNRQEYMTTQEELQLMQESINKEYEHHLELETIKRRQQADAMSPISAGLKHLDEAIREQIRSSTVSSETIDRNVNAKSIESNNRPDKQSGVEAASRNFVNDRLPSIVIGAKCPLPESMSIHLTSSTKQKDSGDTNQGETNDKNNREVIEESDDDDEEEPRANPLVANYQSDLDSDDQIDNK